ncbi:RING/U-box superfamily protein [Raphanus sativus]|uniref:RING-type E3 ubiquitin transferase n=1 Tax=Raphanus sativus TaxID=3726 RepID=A0A6J0N1I9_RAPSA|nr:E3 ubiquitin-protein ligase AIRP1-like [Raphanus sativus]KAJ4899660.1 RING/U-box superfamily protein [Raphanus sativus]
MGCCCCCFPILPESSRSIDEHVPLSHASSSSVVLPTGSVNTNLASNIYTAALQPPLPVSFSPRNPSKLPTITQSNSSQEAKHILPEKQTWPVAVGDQIDINLKKKDQETIDECPICLEEYETENPRLLTKCRHDFHLACILEWMERSEACPVCDQELVLPES